MRWSAGTKSAPPCVVARATKSVMDFLAAPSFQEGSGSLWANALRPANPHNKMPSSATVVQRRKNRRISSFIAKPRAHRAIERKGTNTKAEEASGRTPAASSMRWLFFDAPIPERLVDHLVDLLASALDIEAGWALAWRVLGERLQEGRGLQLSLHHHVIVLGQEVVILVGDDVRALIRIHPQVI